MAAWPPKVPEIELSYGEGRAILAQLLGTRVAADEFGTAVADLADWEVGLHLVEHIAAGTPGYGGVAQ